VRANPYKYIVALIYAAVLFLDRLDLTVVNVTLPTVANFFKVSIVSTDWINLSFLLALAVSIPISSWLGERFGLKKIYIIAIIVFGMGSILCAFAPNLASINLLRFVQGLGGGIIIPLGMTMLYRTFDRSEYASITSFTFLPALIAPTVAPFLGGMLLHYFGWRFVFLFSGPFSIVLAIVGIVILRESDHKIIKPLDWVGFLLGSLLLMDAFYTLSTFGKTGLISNSISGFLVFLVLVMLFIVWEKKSLHPIFDFGLFKNSCFLHANLIQICFQICHFGAIFLVGLYLQVGIGFSPTMAGLMMGMQGAGAMTTSRYSVSLFKRYGAKIPITMGLMGIAFLTPCILLIQSPAMLIFGLTVFFIRGIFSGICGAPIQTLSVINIASDQLSQANSIFNICRQVAISLGIALSSLMILFGLKTVGLSGIGSFPHDQALKVFWFSFVIISVIALSGIALIRQRDLTFVDKHFLSAAAEQDADEI
jgi:EmrB/QacA subfamily drug resistance transporter